MCTINQNHMMYGSWDIEHNRYNFSHFKWLFALLHPNNPENQSFEKMKKKKHLEILSFYTSAPKIMIICYTVPEIWYMADCYFSSWVTFYHFTPLTAWKIKIKKKKKQSSGDTIILHKCTKNHDHILCCSWDMAHDKCNYFSFWANCCPFHPQQLKKSKI